MSPAERVELLTAALPRGLDPYVPHPPHPPQSLFLVDRGREAFYGGAAGGGKSDALLMSALQYVDVPRYSALIIRRTYGDLTLPGAIMDRCQDWLSGTDARPVGGKGWLFPSGARITFGHIFHPKDSGQYKSAEFQMVGFDELTQFQRATYTFMFSRIRKPAVKCGRCSVMVEKVGLGQRSESSEVVLDEETGVEAPAAVGDEQAEDDGWVHRVTQSNYASHCRRPVPSPQALREYPPSAVDGTTLFDVPLRMRAASNPGDVGHAWVRDRFVDPVRRHRSATFYPARLEDNPSLDQEGYRQGLEEMDQVERDRLLSGDWNAVEGGKFFNASWFRIVRPDEVPDGVEWLRYWDLASTEATGRNDPSDPDWTAGALVGLLDGVWYLAHVRRLRGTPGTVEDVIAQTSAEDGHTVPVRIEQEGGSAGVNTIDNYARRILVGRDFDGHRPTGSKEDRARTWSSAAQKGRFVIVEGSWVRDFLDECETFPGGAHDDQVDAVSGAVIVLAGGPTARLIM